MRNLIINYWNYIPVLLGNTLNVQDERWRRYRIEVFKLYSSPSAIMQLIIIDKFKRVGHVSTSRFLKLTLNKLNMNDIDFMLQRIRKYIA